MSFISQTVKRVSNWTWTNNNWIINNKNAAIFISSVVSNLMYCLIIYYYHLWVQKLISILPSIRFERKFTSFEEPLHIFFHNRSHDAIRMRKIHILDMELKYWQQQNKSYSRSFPLRSWHAHWTAYYCQIKSNSTTTHSRKLNQMEYVFPSFSDYF